MHMHMRSFNASRIEMQCPKLFIFCECDGFKVNNLTDPNSSQCNQYDEMLSTENVCIQKQKTCRMYFFHMCWQAGRKKILIEFNDVWACMYMLCTLLTSIYKLSKHFYVSYYFFRVFCFVLLLLSCSLLRLSEHAHCANW